MDKQRVHKRPIACDLSAIDATHRQRHQALWQQVYPTAQGIEELPDGYVIRFPMDRERFMALAEYITLERLCCPFFDFALELGGGSETIHLRLTGRDGVKSFLQAQLGIT